VTLLPVLWLSGASGVGKTTVAWELYVRLVREGVSTGFVDIDQLGICYGAPTPQQWAPEPAADPGRHRRKARALDAVVGNFRDAGARCLIVPGVTDAARGVETDLLPHAVLTTCRLRVDPVELRRRLAARGQPIGDLTEEFAYAEALDRAGRNSPCVDTTGLTVAEVADRVRASTGWPDLAAQAGLPRPGGPPPVPTPGEVLFLCGPAAVGKSTVGWLVYERVRRAGVDAAFVDLDQIGSFLRPAPATDPGNHRLKAANLAAVWRTFRATGTHCVVAVGPLDGPDDVATYTAALPAARITLCRLQASPEVLADRVARRGRGIVPTWGLAGDELIGRPEAWLREFAGRAARTMAALDGVGDLFVETDDRPADAIAAQVLERAGWPASRP
jgi:hypothetical protein